MLMSSAAVQNITNLSELIVGLFLFKIHEEKKSFKCNTPFSQKRHLNGHIESVQKENKSFKCNDCNSFFSRHMESVHERKKPFKCYAS